MSLLLLILITMMSLCAFSSPGLATPSVPTITISGDAKSGSEAKVRDEDLILPGTHGTIGFNSSSFFYKSTARGTSATTIQATFKTKSDSYYFHTEGDLMANSFVTEEPQFGVESHELFIESQKGLLGNFTISAGRKIIEWSKLDRTWRMMSLWSPRWTWDELHPEIVGMTGLFLKYENSNFQFVAYGSPIAIPERGSPIEEKNGTIVSPNPLTKPLPTEILVMNQPTKVSYSLMMPAMQEILLRPNFAVRARYKTDAGLFASLNSGVLPVNMTQMAAEPFLAPSAGTDLQVYIRPQFPLRNINTLEVGYDSPEKDWELWLSGSYEQPFRFENEANWLNPIITPSTIISSGSSVQLTQNFRFESGLIFIHEDPFTSTSSLKGVDVQLPSRFPLKQGIKVGGSWTFSEAAKTRFAWVQDLINQNHFVSGDYEHRILSSGLTLGAGIDLIMADNNRGWVGQYYGNDRLRGWMKYAF